VLEDEEKQSNWKNIYVLSFKNMAIMVSCFFFIGLFDKILSLNFDLGFLRVKIYCVRKNQFCKGL
jgi:hypothetical protein